MDFLERKFKLKSCLRKNIHYLENLDFFGNSEFLFLLV